MKDAPQIVGSAHLALLEFVMQDLVGLGRELAYPLPIRDRRTVLAASDRHNGEIAAKGFYDCINGF